MTWANVLADSVSSSVTKKKSFITLALVHYHGPRHRRLGRRTGDDFRDSWTVQTCAIKSSNCPILAVADFATLGAASKVAALEAVVVA